MKILRQVLLQRCKLVLFSRMLHGSSGFTYEPRYSGEEQKKILQTLNNDDDLEQFAVSKTRITTLKKFRIKNGPFQRLNDVLEVEGLSVKTFEQLCASILDNKVQEGKKDFKKLNINRLVTPSAKFINSNDIQNIVSLHLSRNNVISWAKLTKERELVDWDMYELPQDFKNHPCHLYDVLIRAKRQIPAADLYVMEDVRSTAQHFTDVQFYLLRTILYTLLNYDRTTQDQLASTFHHVFFLKHHIPARLFERLVGSEKVSAKMIVSKILDNEHPRSVDVDDSLKFAYSVKTNVEKELLGEALLLSISFMDLIVLRKVERIP